MTPINLSKNYLIIQISVSCMLWYTNCFYPTDMWQNMSLPIINIIRCDSSRPIIIIGKTPVLEEDLRLPNHMIFSILGKSSKRPPEQMTNNPIQITASLLGGSCLFWTYWVKLEDTLDWSVGMNYARRTCWENVFPLKSHRTQ